MKYKTFYIATDKGVNPNSSLYLKNIVGLETFQFFRLWVFGFKANILDAIIFFINYVINIFTVKTMCNYLIKANGKNIGVVTLILDTIHITGGVKNLVLLPDYEDAKSYLDVINALVIKARDNNQLFITFDMLADMKDEMVFLKQIGFKELAR